MRGRRRRCRGRGAGCAVGRRRLRRLPGPTTIVAGRPAEASVAPGVGPAAAPAAIPKPSMSSVAMPATRGEGTGQAVAGRRGAAGGGRRRSSPAVAAPAPVRERIQARRPAPLAAAQAVALVGRERLATGRARLARGSEHRRVDVDGGLGRPRGGPGILAPRSSAV